MARAFWRHSKKQRNLIWLHYTHTSFPLFLLGAILKTQNAQRKWMRCFGIMLIVSFGACFSLMAKSSTCEIHVEGRHSRNSEKLRSDVGKLSYLLTYQRGEEASNSQNHRIISLHWKLSSTSGWRNHPYCTSKTRSAFGGITPPAPWRPYLGRNESQLDQLNSVHRTCVILASCIRSVWTW